MTYSLFYYSTFTAPSLYALKFLCITVNEINIKITSMRARMCLAFKREVMVV